MWSRQFSGKSVIGDARDSSRSQKTPEGVHHGKAVRAAFKAGITPSRMRDSLGFPNRTYERCWRRMNRKGEGRILVLVPVDVISERSFSSA